MTAASLCNLFLSFFPTLFQKGRQMIHLYIGTMQTVRPHLQPEFLKRSTCYILKPPMIWGDIHQSHNSQNTGERNPNTFRKSFISLQLLPFLSLLALLCMPFLSFCTWIFSNKYLCLLNFWYESYAIVDPRIVATWSVEEGGESHLQDVQSLASVIRVQSPGRVLWPSREEALLACGGRVHSHPWHL